MADPKLLQIMDNCVIAETMVRIGEDYKNGYVWEYKEKEHEDDFHEPYWKTYKMGDPIHSDWQYRRKELYGVWKNTENHKEYIIDIYNSDVVKTPLFKGSMEECQRWIYDNTPKTWFENKIKFITDADYFDGFAKGSKDTADEIIERVKNTNCDIISFTALKKIVDDLGIKNYGN